MAAAFIVSVSGSSSAGNGFTTSAINTTGANFLTAEVSDQDGTSVVSDNQGNTWTALTSRVAGTNPMVTIWYSKNPLCGAGHTFTVTATGKFPSVDVQAFSGADTTAPFDVLSAGGTSGLASVQPGSITPGADGEIVVCGIALTNADTYTINSLFTKTDQVAFAGGAHYGVAGAYLIQAAAAAVNPTWSWTNNNTAASAQASFKAASGGATPIPNKVFEMLQAVPRAAYW